MTKLKQRMIEADIEAEQRYYFYRLLEDKTHGIEKKLLKIIEQCRYEMISAFTTDELNKILNFEKKQFAYIQAQTKKLFKLGFNFTIKKIDTFGIYLSNVSYKNINLTNNIVEYNNFYKNFIKNYQECIKLIDNKDKELLDAIDYVKRKYNSTIRIDDNPEYFKIDNEMFKTYYFNFKSNYKKKMFKVEIVKQVEKTISKRFNTKEEFREIWSHPRKKRSKELRQRFEKSFVRYLNYIQKKYDIYSLIKPISFNDLRDTRFFLFPEI